MHLRTLATSLFLSVAATAASATTILFDFQQGLNNPATANYSVDGLGLTVTSTGGNIARGNRGLGVTGNPEGGWLGLGEELSFSFGQAIQSVTVVMRERGPSDGAFTFGGIGDGSTLTFGNGNGQSTATFTETLSIATSAFSVIGLEPDVAGGAGVRVASIEVTLAPIPVPASGGLLLAGLIGLGAYKRRKSIS